MQTQSICKHLALHMINGIRENLRKWLDFKQSHSQTLFKWKGRLFNFKCLPYKYNHVKKGWRAPINIIILHSDFPSLFMAREPWYAIFSPSLLLFYGCPIMPHTWLLLSSTHMIAALFLIIFLHQKPQRLFPHAFHFVPRPSSTHLDFVFNAL